MSDYTDPATAGLRLSHGDRDDAVAALGRARTDGRITDAEYSERSAAVAGATTRGDLAPLFADLPDTVHQSIPSAATSPAPDPDLGPPRDSYTRTRPLGGSAGVVAVSLTPIIALIVFLGCGFLFGGWAWSWVVWLAVPIVGIIVYGAGGRRGYDRD